MWNLKHDANKHIYKTQRHTDLENRLAVAKGEERTGRLGLSEANYYVQDRQTTRFYSIA